MAGFCGMCGAPRDDTAKFCPNCGVKFAAVERLCPTCGQVWPQPDATASPLAAVVDPPAEAPAAPPAVFAAVRGTYSSDHGHLYYDGTGWFRARALADDVWLPDPGQPLPGFDPEGTGLTLLVAEETGDAVPSGLPRGPQLGPDYRPGRDCGNCGFEMVAGVVPCPRCGTENTGPVFRPGG